MHTLQTQTVTIEIDTPATQLHWVCVGYDTRQQRNDALGYWCDTAQQAKERCQKLHPTFDVYYVKRGDLS